MKWIRLISWTCYIVGIVIILASYLRFVSGEVGWFGWGIGMFGWVLQFVGREKNG